MRVRRAQLFPADLYEIRQAQAPLGVAVGEHHHGTLATLPQPADDLLVMLGVKHYGLCAAVLHEEPVVLGTQQGVCGYGHGPDAHGREERDRESRGIVEDHQHPVLLLDTEVQQRVAEPVDAGGQLPIGHPLSLAVDRNLLRAAGL